MPSIHGPMTLGEIIAALDAAMTVELEEYLQDNTKPPERPVYIDWNRMIPHGLDSYRGYYDHLAIGFSPRRSQPAPTVKEFLADCMTAMGRTYTGYKGGSYTMDENTPVWVANYGESGGWGVSAVKDGGAYCVILETKEFD